MNHHDDQGSDAESTANNPSRPDYIVGIGASAGGVEALERMFAKVPSDTGMAFVIVQHLSPDFESMMDELLRRQTDLPIHTVEDGVAVEANAIYLIPPRKEMIISDGHLLLTDKDRSSGLTLPIDQFFRSLAQDQEDRSIGVILSGTGSDGSRGVRDIHEAGGLVLVQNEDTARFDGMPKSAMETGVVDLALAPEEIAETLLKYSRHPVRSELSASANQPPVNEDAMNRLLRLLRDAHGIDFSLYKPSTVTRRIERRLMMNQSVDFDSYVDHVEQHPEELDSLYHDLLIGVTQFFRDREAFALLESQIIPEILHNVSATDEVRFWIAGCATGEEAYSMAILLHEQFTIAKRSLNVKIFATDVHQKSLDIASAGIYSTTSLTDVSPTRLQRYFTRKGDGYQIVPELRQMIVFAPHNIIKDAPFTKLDFISCRNLLIYLQPGVQKKAISLFHFGLKTGGILVLGPSEGVGDLDDEFKVLDRHWKVYRKRRDVRLPADMRLPLSTGAAHLRASRMSGSARNVAGANTELSLAYEQIVAEHVPPAVLVNVNRQLIHIFGAAADFLRFQPGRASSDVLDLFDADMKTALSGAIQRATKEQTSVSYSGITVQTPHGPKSVRLGVKPLIGSDSDVAFLLITIVETESRPPRTDASCEAFDVGEISRERIASLESELRHTRENLQATIEELETSNEELHATNEELVASNEELQSTNEELHSVNEELYTVNVEYQRKITELTELTDDMNNLLESTEIGTVFLDRDLCIRRITPHVAQLFNILPQDTGRRIDNFTHNIEHPKLLDDVHQVLESGKSCEHEVRDRFGRWHFLRICPYRAQSGVEGVVLTLIDIESLKKAEAALREQDQRLQGILDNSPSFIFIKDLEGRYIVANGPAHEVLGQPCEKVVGHTDYDFLPQHLADRIQAHDRDVLTSGETLSVEEPIGEDGRTWLTVRYPLRGEGGRITSVAGIYTDVTRLKKAEQTAQEGVRHRDRFLAVLSHELRNPLASISNTVQCLTRINENGATDEITNLTAILMRQTGQLARLTDDLLDISRIEQGKIELRRKRIDLRDTSMDASESVRSLMAERHITYTTDIPDDPLCVYGDPARLQQVLINLLINAGKYTPAGGNVKLVLKRNENRIVVEVIDDGVGMTQELIDTVFEPFVQASHTMDRSDGGMGVGLTLVRSLMLLHDGTVTAESEGLGKGSRFCLSFPEARPSHDHDVHNGHSHSTRTAPAADTTHLRIVIVEDNADARSTLRMLLEMDGYQVHEAKDGEAGVRTILEHRPDVALVDIGLPEIDGYEVARRVRGKLPGDTDVYLFALTGYGHQKDKRRAREAGFDDHITKPLDIAELYERLAGIATKVSR